MPKIRYKPLKFSPKTLELIEQANEIIAEYTAQGYDLTLRQLYYQFVSRDIIPNNQKEYKRLGSIINDARLAGQIDWYHITDRTRNLAKLPDWESPEDIIQGAAAQYRIDKWQGQPYRVEVWIEKEALAGVFGQVCRELQIPWFSCRGYTSQSEMWSAAQRLKGYSSQSQRPVILHFGDHDPSGIDMTRDIQDRLALFGVGLDLDRLALNMDQVEEYGPPPNPAKLTDSRAAGYIERFGDDSWELDALEPEVLAGLVRAAVVELRDEAKWQEQLDKEEGQKAILAGIAGNWNEVVDWLQSRDGE